MKPIINDLGKRWKLVAEKITEGNFSKLAKKLNMHPTLLSQVKAGQKSLPDKYDSIIKSLNINPDWIRTGEGDMTIGAITINGNNNSMKDLQHLLKDVEIGYGPNKTLVEKIAMLEGQVEFLKNQLERLNDQNASFMELLKTKK